MPIDWDVNARQFHLHDSRLSYVMRVLDSGSLAYLHFGAPLAAGVDYQHRRRATRPPTVQDPEARARIEVDDDGFYAGVDGRLADLCDPFRAARV